ncbi:MAG: polysaccharide biosynthesis tyrosine autokinase [Actinomycetota bacterium]
MAEQTRFLDLSDYWHMVRRRLWVPIVFAVIIAGLAAAFIVTKTPTYLARAKVQVLPIVNPLLSSTALSGSAVEPDMATEAEIVSSVQVADLVREAVSPQTTAQQLLKGLRVELIGDSTVMYIGYEDPDKDAAQTLANAFAVAYLENRVAEDKETLDKKIVLFNDRIAEKQALLETAETDVERGLYHDDISELEDQRTDVENVREGLQGGQLYSQATRPETPTGIGLVPVIVLGSLVGALLGAGIAIAMGLMDDRVSDRHELSEQLDSPVLGVIPSVDGWNDRAEADLAMATEPGGAAAEAYRTLATNVRFLRSQHLLDVVVVTSALPGEGKSATATNLAWALAETGLHVVLVDADLRRPRASDFFGVPDGPGLRDALEGTSVRQLLTDTDLEGLSLLASGATPHDPVALLAQADSVFAELRALADVVIADSPPVLPVADASILAELGDGVILVHDPSISSKTALEEAVGQLTTAGGSIIGGAYNNISFSQRMGMGFTSYETYYGSDDRPEVPRRQRRGETRPVAPPQRATKPGAAKSSEWGAPVEPKAPVARREPVEPSEAAEPPAPAEPAAPGGPPVQADRAEPPVPADPSLPAEPPLPSEPPMPVEPTVAESDGSNNGDGTVVAPTRGGSAARGRRGE